MCLGAFAFVAGSVFSSKVVFEQMEVLFLGAHDYAFQHEDGQSPYVKYCRLHI